MIKLYVFYLRILINSDWYFGDLRWSLHIKTMPVPPPLITIDLGSAKGMMII